VAHHAPRDGGRRFVRDTRDVEEAIEAMVQIRAGIAELSRNPNGGERAKLPEDAKRMRAWAMAHIGHILAGVNPVEHEELAALRAQRTLATHPLAELPLVVVTRGVADDSPELEADHRKDHAAVAALSRRGRLVVAPKSGHHVQLDDPALVVSVVRDLIAQLTPRQPR
jgi:pimeloyl-ACP methyl ester carboxylesterase